MAGLLSFNDKLPLELAAGLDSFDFCLRGVFWEVNDILVEGQRHEPQALVTDYLTAWLSAATARAKPVVVAVNHLLDGQRRSLLVFLLYHFFEFLLLFFLLARNDRKWVFLWLSLEGDLVLSDCVKAELVGLCKDLLELLRRCVV